MEKKDFTSIICSKCHLGFIVKEDTFILEGNRLFYDCPCCNTQTEVPLKKPRWLIEETEDESLIRRLFNKIKLN